MQLNGLKIKNLNATQQAQLLQLKDLYEDLNQKINVISRKDMEGFYIHHVLHSLAIANVFSFEAGCNIMDLGSGGGFPGIPLAIYFPQVQFHLVDSIGKKLKVVEQVADALQLNNVSVQHARAEDIRDRRFDGVLSRAVAPMKELWKWSEPLLNKKSSHYYGLICLKGGELDDEISQVNRKVGKWEIYKKIYDDPWFQNKYILQIR